VTVSDAGLVFANLGTLARIDIGAGGPFAPEGGDGGGTTIAAALAAPATAAEPPAHDSSEVVVAVAVPVERAPARSGALDPGIAFALAAEQWRLLATASTGGWFGHVDEQDLDLLVDGRFPSARRR
jgi:hypothetical protein